MKAAVVNSFGIPPSFQEFPLPEAGDDETIITVEAAAISPIVKLLASGRHYTSGNTAGFVPGVDGIGRDAEGKRVYFLFPKAPFGSLAEKSLATRAMTVPIADGLASDRAAALATGALASWVALSRRAKLQRGETVLIVGATGSSGSMAIQTARHFGAIRIVAVGRNEQKLDRLDADVKIALDDDADRKLREQFDQGIDVVLDFVWGEPAVRVLRAATKDRGSRMGEPRLRYVQLGTMAGAEISIRGDMLRSTGLELIGSGVGSVAVADLLAGAGELLDAAPIAGFDTNFTSVPLSRIENAWNGDPNIRYILLPGQ
ncbi:Zn-dependent alcohol dehydrogenase GroES-like protein (plasmid) [Rhizobium etli]|uniref:Zn-dependent alcohol dehydrogenase GroES-like protein n=1 Tax=Rhizobium etli TaxID=29449 RepID=A0AAN1BM86_RHIET|nr:zinc-binding alcohol dehydrogenase family protein [Rhizobium etli]AGS26599.1 Zn-dependent alcohol dehydrogenase GroES-like protein [Rhizobium etli bv. mimosae str. Mim1]ARQ13779.1 Zn-dependent alcohol dehydrogenase GroES-like protein [Rhizobium etli]